MGTVHGGIEYLTCAETPIRVRRAPREQWPEVTFCVRSGTALRRGSIDVLRFDSPLAASPVN